MFDAFLTALSWCVDAFLFRGASSNRRTYNAYAETARKFQVGSADGLAALRDAFKAHSAPGAYADPDGVSLQPWIASWQDARTPRQARRFANAARP